MFTRQVSRATFFQKFLQKVQVAVIIFLVIEMTEKDTQQLENELSKAEEIENFLDDNREIFQNFSLAEYLEQLLAEKNLSKTEVAKKSLLNQIYVYHIFAGRKKNPSRQKILSIALAMELTPKETQKLLYCAGLEKLYVKNSWDSIILFALENKFSVERTNNLLIKFSESPLLGDVEK